MPERVTERMTDHQRAARRANTAPMFRALLIAGLVAGCGGKHAESTTTGGGTTGGEPVANQGGEQVPPEKMDEINRNLERKRPVMSRCLGIAVDNKELPKNSRGKVTLEIVISPSGKADNVKVVRSSLESKTLNECLINHVKEISFPELPKPYETSYTYGFEAM
jgi:TonB family protein